MGESMRRGTTPTIIINFKNTDMESIETWYITIKQDNVAITKINDDITIITDNGTIEVRLTERETMMFRSGEAELQVRAVTKAGDRVAGEIKRFPVDRILNNEVI